MFRNVWVYLGTFRCCVKLGANRADLVQLMEKFVQQSRVGIFRNEGTQSIIGFWILNSCPGAFRNVGVHLGLFRLHKTQSKLG